MKGKHMQNYPLSQKFTLTPKAGNPHNNGGYYFLF